MVRVLSEFYGKGPSRARTYIFDNYVFCMLDDVLTPVEQTLHEGGETQLVRDLRLTFEDLMTKTFTREVERVTGRRVVAYHSQVVFDPNLAFEIFVLDPAGFEPPSSEIQMAALDPPGRIGDADKLPKPCTDPIASAGPREGHGTRYGTGQPGGQLRAAISNAMMRLTREFYGRGPERAKTYLADNYVFCVLEDLLTTVERTLLDAEQSLLVRHVRLRFQDLAGDAFVREIETLTRRRVVAAHSQIVFDPDTVFHVFVLARDGSAGDVGVAKEDADVESVGPR